MRKATRRLAVVAGLLLLVQRLAAGDDARQGGAVTIIGNTMTNSHLGMSEKGVFVYALDGPTEVKAEVEKIMADYPDDGLDADAAQRIQQQFAARLKYRVKGPSVERLLGEVEYGSRMLALAGVVEEAGGEKWLEVTKYEPA
ncbi:MAG TPA: hypothetical protein VG125_07630, partial [Pirellulales bacterium]|nr:hypothetical protein [Pirellulales bacterium]